MFAQIELTRVQTACSMYKKEWFVLRTDAHWNSISRITPSQCVGVKCWIHRRCLQGCRGSARTHTDTL